MPDIRRTRLKQTIVIENLITLLYFEFAKNHVFEGESHDFWECVYVDKGEVDVTAGLLRHVLKPGMIIFHKPNEFHSFSACNGTAPNIMVFTFDCSSPAMKFFECKVICLEDEERVLLANVIKEGKHTFEYPFDIPLVRRRSVEPGSEQLIRIYLEQLFIRLLRRVTLSPSKLQAQPQLSHLTTVSKERSDQELVRSVIGFLDENISRSLSLTEISHSLHVARTRLKEMFKRRTGETIMCYFMNMKIEHAKRLIREEALSFTEIAERVGFSSPHQFSKAFKRISGMTPSEYAHSVIALSVSSSNQYVPHRKKQPIGYRGDGSRRA